MSTKDDALIEAMDEAFWAPHPANSTPLDSMRAALAIARKAILEEAAKTAEATDVIVSATGAFTVFLSTRNQIAAAIRSLANQEQNND